MREFARNISTILSTRISRKNAERLSLMTCAEEIKNIGMIDKLSDTSFNDSLVLCVQHHELVRVHRDPHVVILEEGADASELTFKLLLPWHGIYRMGGEGDKVRGYPEEEESRLCIE